MEKEIRVIEFTYMYIMITGLILTPLTTGICKYAPICGIILFISALAMIAIETGIRNGI